MLDFLTVGAGTRDIFLRVAEGKVISGPPGGSGSPLYLGFEYGAKIITHDADFSYGGGAVNTAVGLAKMGLAVAACFRIGLEGTGDILLAKLQELQVDPRYVERDPHLHTGLSFVINVPDADHVLFHYPGASENLALPGLADIGTRWLYLTSLTGSATQLLPRIESKVRADSIKLVFNPGETQIAPGYASISTLIGQAHALVVNRQEAAELVRSADPSAPTGAIPELIRVMRGWGARHVVVTDGQSGAYAADDAQIYFMPSYPLRVVDTTGAGDAFGAAFAAGLAHYDGDIPGALRLASANAASVVSRDGAHAGSLNRIEAERLVERHEDIRVQTIA